MVATAANMATANNTANIATSDGFNLRFDSRFLSTVASYPNQTAITKKAHGRPSVGLGALTISA
jgi:hypothetical protein